MTAPKFGATTLAHYRILDKLGAGDMGEVYRAHDDQLDREVAIKVLPSTSFEDPVDRARLLQEARAAAALNHPHICTVHEVGEADGQTYIAMELVDGQALSEQLKAGPLPVTAVSIRAKTHHLDSPAQAAGRLQHGLPSCGFLTS